MEPQPIGRSGQYVPAMVETTVVFDRETGVASGYVRFGVAVPSPCKHGQHVALTLEAGVQPWN